MLYHDDGDAVFVGQGFEESDVLVVGGIRIGIHDVGAHLLQRVNDDEVGVGMLGDELLDLLQQPVRQGLGEGGEVQIGRQLLP